PQETYVLMSEVLLWTLIAMPLTLSRLAGTTVVDLPSTTFSSPCLGFGSSLAQLPSWICAGWAVPFGAPFRLISTRVLSAPSAVSLALPVSPESFCACMRTFMLLPPFLPSFFASCANATPAAVASTRMPVSTCSFIAVSLVGKGAYVNSCAAQSNPFFVTRRGLTRYEPCSGLGLCQPDRKRSSMQRSPGTSPSR